MTAKVVVVGAGIIGLFAARGLRQAGHDVTIVDPRPARGASWVAAGMLAPLSELEYGHEDLFRLNRVAAEAWPDVAASLSDSNGIDVGFRAQGSLLVARDHDDMQRLRELASFATTQGVDLPERRARECRRLEPFLGTGIVGGLEVAGDHSVDPRLVTSALLADLRDTDVTLVEAAVQPLAAVNGSVGGVTLTDGTRLDADEVVIAAGTRSRALMATLDDLPVRPVKGERLLLRASLGQATLTRVVRGLVRGGGVYLVPRGNGDHILGATVLEMGEDTSVTAGGVWELLRDARDILPGITEWELVESIAGLRPSTPDNGPLLGRMPGVNGVILATGHHRNGVLLAPVTADTVVTTVAGLPLAVEAAPFVRDRFPS